MINLKDIRKIHLVGDLHLGIKNNAVEWLEIQKSFLLEDLIEKVDRDFDPDRDILIFEGDIFHSRESVNIRIQNESFAIFAQLAKKFKRGIYIILGNHDVYYKDKNTVNSVKSLSYLSDNIHVFEKAEVISFNGLHNFLMLPWVDDFTRLAGIIEDYRDDAQYIICHADVKGLTLNKWAKVEHGIELSALSTFKKVFSGHIHIRQEKANLLYTGTPYQMDRGDRDNQKGHYVLDVSGQQIIEEFLPNTKSPVFLKLDIFNVLEMTQAEVDKLFKNNFVDIMISVNFASRLSVTNFLEKVQTSGYRKIEFFTYVDNKSEETVTQVEFDLQDNFNINDIFSHYLQTRDYSEAVKEALSEKFVSTLQKVRELDKYA